MATTTRKHWDAWGNPILPYPEMRKIYQFDQHSLEHLRKHLPHRTVVLPDIEIRIDLDRPSTVTVYYIYPAGNESRTFILSLRALDALRRTYKGRKGWCREVTKSGWVILRHKGTLILEPTGKFWR
jgi:hypothetical protein